MEDEKVELVEDIAHTPEQWGFTVRWRYWPHWADCEVFAYIGEEMSAPPRMFYNRKDSNYSPNPVYSIDEAEPYLTGFIKWDGCSEFDFMHPHWCGPHDYRKHFRLLEALYKRAQELMENGNWKPWDKAADPRNGGA